MNIELDKLALTHLVMGTQGPNYSLFNHPKVKPTGSYWDQGGWSWNKYYLESLSETSLVELYVLIRSSWNWEK